MGGEGQRQYGEEGVNISSWSLNELQKLHVVLSAFEETGQQIFEDTYK